MYNTWQNFIILIRSTQITSILKWVVILDPVFNSYLIWYFRKCKTYWAATLKTHRPRINQSLKTTINDNTIKSEHISSKAHINTPFPTRHPSTFSSPSTHHHHLLFQLLLKWHILTHGKTHSQQVRRPRTPSGP